MIRRTFVAVVLALVAAVSHAQDAWPSRVIRLVVPYPAGGIADRIGREVAQRLQERLGQNVIVENRTGAAGNVGMDFAAKQPPDGYTFVIAPASNLTVNAVLFRNLTYDIGRDFEPLSLLIVTPQVLVVNAAAVPARTLADLVAHAKARPGALSFGSPGIGTFPHLAGEMLNGAAGIRMNHIAYQGLAPAVTDLVGGHTQVGFVEIVTAAQHVKSGRLAAIAIAAPNRAAFLPDVPTSTEAGLPQLQVQSWYGIIARAGTPAPIMQRMARELAAIMRSDEMKQRYGEIGAESIGSTPEEFARFIRTETDRWTAVIRANRIEPQ